MLELLCLHHEHNGALGVLPSGSSSYVLKAVVWSGNLRFKEPGALPVSQLTPQGRSSGLRGCIQGAGGLPFLTQGCQWGGGPGLCQW